jgi:antitoxin CcdA
MASAGRKSTHLSLDPDLIEQAQALGVNLSEVAEGGIRAAVAAARAERWQQENASAIAGYNRWIERHGLPLEAYRGF